MLSLFKNLSNNADEKRIKEYKEKIKELKLQNKALNCNLDEVKTDLDKIVNHYLNVANLPYSYYIGKYYTTLNSDDSINGFTHIKDIRLGEKGDTLVVDTFGITQDLLENNSNLISIKYCGEKILECAHWYDIVLSDSIKLLPRGSVLLSLESFMDSYEEKVYEIAFAEVNADYSGFLIEPDFEDIKAIKKSNTLSSSEQSELKYENEIKQLEYKKNKVKYKRICEEYLGNLYLKTESDGDIITKTIAKVTDVVMSSADTIDIEAITIKIVESGDRELSITSDLSQVMTLDLTVFGSDYSLLTDYELKERLITSVREVVDTYVE